MSELKTNKISPATGTDVTLGDSGDTFTIPSGATIVNSGTATNFGDSLPAVGSSGNVMTSDGTNWASTAPAGGGAWTLISTQVYVDDGTYNGGPSDMTFTGLDDTYDHYAISLSNVQGWNGGQYLAAQFGNAGGWYTSSNYINSQLSGYNGSSTPYTRNASGVSYMYVSGNNTGQNSNQQNDHMTFTMYLTRGKQTNGGYSWPSLNGSGSLFYTSGEAGGMSCRVIAGVACVLKASYQATKIKFYWTSNEFKNGRISLYGISHT